MQTIVGGAVDHDRAGIALIDAGDDLDQRRFAAPVFADQAVDFASFDRQIDFAERLHPGKGFVNAGETDNFIGHGWPGVSIC